MGGASVDVCGGCHGTWFDSGEMFMAFGAAADPSAWDRPETGGVVKAGTLQCPRCEQVVMQAQDVSHEGKHVEIDRCGKCGGIWLDRDEIDRIAAIGDAMRPLLEAARAKAQQELEKLGPVSFRAPMERWKIAAAALLLGLVGLVAYALVRASAPVPEHRTRAIAEEGCPCGCDRSAKMAADLRRQHAPRRVSRSASAGRDDAAPKAIEKALVTIRERENVGYVTERMIQHRLRLLDLAADLRLDVGGGVRPDVAWPAGERCKAPRVGDQSLRVCADLVVHGERTEIVDGHDKLITSCFRLWLEIENLTAEERTLAMPTIDGGAVHFPISRWYVEQGDGQPWSGVLRAGEKIRVNVIGYIPEHIPPGASTRADIALGPLMLHASTDARAVIHLQSL